MGEITRRDPAEQAAVRYVRGPIHPPRRGPTPDGAIRHEWRAMHEYRAPAPLGPALHAELARRREHALSALLAARRASRAR